MADQTPNEQHGKTLFIRNLPYSTKSEELEKIFSDVGPIKSCFVVKDSETGKCRGFGYVKFTLREDAEKAHQTIKKINGRKVHLLFANKKEKKKTFGKPCEPTAKPQDATKKKLHAPVVKGQKQPSNPLNEGKRARVIFRNLSFKCSIEDLKKACSKFGTIVDVHIPKKASGLKLGFGFVQFTNKAQAGMAIKEMHGKDLCGRVVAVDWTLPKDKFVAGKQKPDSMNDTSELEVDEKSEKNDAADSETMDDEDVESNYDDNTNKEEDDDHTSEEEEDKKNETSDVDMESNDGSSHDDSDDDEENNDDDDEYNKDDNNDEGETPFRKSGHFSDRPSDVQEGRTVFIRNLPFNTEDEKLEEIFSAYGKVNYGRIVVDHATGMSRGTAFVQFSLKESADSCIKAAAENEVGITIGERRLIVSLAVSRQQAVDLLKQKEKKKEQKDSRNLYLAREGLIREGTEAAKDVPPADLIKRNKIAAANRAKLKNDNIFVSSTRLCVHNIPATVTDKTLRKVMYKAAGDKSAKVTECRIMRDLNRVTSQGVAKSRGFAFCAFSKHEHSLNALRHLNNNPEIFGDKKRPIVEFSLENIKALQVKQRRIEKSQAKCKQIEASSEKGGAQSKKRRKRNRGQERKPLDEKKSEDQAARSLYQGPLGLPSHAGPKLRHKKRTPSQRKEKIFKVEKFNVKKKKSIVQQLL